MKLHTDNVSYYDEGIELEGFVAAPSMEKRPLVILCHAWKGRDDFICEKARQIAEWGYIGFASDMYGKGVIGKSAEENAALKKPFVENRGYLQKRILKAYEVARNLPFVDDSRIAVLGLGFGGICSLDLARSGVDLKGAISIYGHLDAPQATLVNPIKVKILVLHGYKDPVVDLEELSRFQQEMDRSNVDWQAHVYGEAKHGFATPTANAPEAGILYNPTAAARAWLAVHSFLNELFI